MMQEVTVSLSEYGYRCDQLEFGVVSFVVILSFISYPPPFTTPIASIHAYIDDQGPTPRATRLFDILQLWPSLAGKEISRS